MHDARSDLELVQGFLNTVNLEEGPDEIATPRALRGWLVDAGLSMGRSKAPTDEELHRVLTVREALRDLVGVNVGMALPPAAHAVLQEAGGRARLTVRFGTDGATVTEPLASGIDGAVGQILAAVHRAMDRGAWQQLKLCGRDCCRWAFVDSSKNRSKRWCSMETCGNREKGEAFRHRHRATTKAGERRAEVTAVPDGERKK